MQPDTGTPRPGYALAALAALLALAACDTFQVRAPRDGLGEPPVSSIERSASPSALTQHLDAIQKLLAADPAAQAALIETARLDAESSRLAGARLRQALLLGTPNHGGYDPAAAVTILTDILAVPATLPPPERALALVELQRITTSSSLTAENKRLREQVERLERDQLVSLNRRLQAEIDENTRLRKQLEEARSKLDAVGKIETGNRRP